jgi:hypothetical protein
LFWIKSNCVNYTLQHTNANSASISEMEIGMQRAKSEKRGRGSRTQRGLGLRSAGTTAGSGRVGSGRAHGKGTETTGERLETRPSYPIPKWFFSFT